MRQTRREIHGGNKVLRKVKGKWIAAFCALGILTTMPIVHITANFAIEEEGLVSIYDTEFSSKFDKKDEMKVLDLVKAETLKAKDQITEKWEANSIEDVKRELQRQRELDLPVYVIQWGDTIPVIADALGVDANKLAEVNDLKDPNKIITGDILILDELVEDASTTKTVKTNKPANVVNVTIPTKTESNQKPVVVENEKTVEETIVVEITSKEEETSFQEVTTVETNTTETVTTIQEPTTVELTTTTTEEVTTLEETSTVAPTTTEEVTTVEETTTVVPTTTEELTTVEENTTAEPTTTEEVTIVEETTTVVPTTTEEVTTVEETTMVEPTTTEELTTVAETTTPSYDEIMAKRRQTVESFNNGTLVDFKAINKAFLELVNADRTARGKEAYSYAEHTYRAGLIRSRELAKNGSIRFDGVPHARPNGDSWVTVYQDPEINSYVNMAQGAGENSASNYVGIDQPFYHYGNPIIRDYDVTDPNYYAELFFNQWKNSPGHYGQLMGGYASTSIALQMGSAPTEENRDSTFIVATGVISHLTDEIYQRQNAAFEKYNVPFDKAYAGEIDLNWDYTDLYELGALKEPTWEAYLEYSYGLRNPVSTEAETTVQQAEMPEISTVPTAESTEGPSETTIAPVEEVIAETTEATTVQPTVESTEPVMEVIDSSVSDTTITELSGETLEPETSTNIP